MFQPALWLTLLALAATAGAPAAVPADEGFLVWTATDQAAGKAGEPVPGERTVWLDAAGQELAARDGLWLAHGGRLYQVETRRKSVALPTCEDLESPRPQKKAGGANGSLQGLYLRPVGGGAPIPVRPLPAAAAEGAAEYDEHVVVTAALGPYLFVESRVFSFSCGAHGDTVADAFVFDLTTGAPTKALAPAGEELERLERRAREQLAAAAEEEREEPLETADEPGEHELVGLAATAPVWQKGRLALHHLWWAEACYACGDGAWSSYTTTTTVKDDEVPAALAAEATLPAPVAARLEAAGEKRAGVTRAPTSLRAAFEAK